jgi:FlaA1/EpsC-like NDP-sugar epimerase
MLKSKVYKTIKPWIVNNRRVFVIFFHLLQAALANYLAFVLRLEFVLAPEYIAQLKLYLPILLVIRLLSYLAFGLYKDLWRYSSVSDLLNILKSTTAGSVVFFFIVRYLFGDTAYPRSVYFLDWLLLITLAGGTRFFIRIFREYLQSDPEGKGVLLIGAGDAGEMIVRDMKSNPKNTYDPVGFIDDDPYKKGRAIHGVPIFGPRSMMKEVIRKYVPQEILITMPSSGQSSIKELYELCKPFNIPIKTLPAMRDIIDGKVTVSQVKPLSLEDLLQREQVRTDIETVREYIQGKTVLVTGAGGSIGSELSRQILEYNPSLLILFDRYENGLFEIDLELNKKVRGRRSEAIGKTPPITYHPSPVIHTVVGDMRDRVSLDFLFSRHKPQIVFHAAAHKHVPLMEHNPVEAVKNNVFGTRNLVEFASKHGSDSFVMISTDKAVNPTNIMGASKRISEFISITMNQTSRTKYTTVRFGNVLGSNGSVVKVFREQVKQGGPVTVTHPEIKRYFMLIPEAVQLVLIGAAAGTGGEIFVLDMGEQIRIVDLAENLIRLSGFVPYEDIKIEFTGLRPGEKLYEELFDESEKIMPTFNDKLRIAVPSEVPSPNALAAHLESLYRIVSYNSPDDLIAEIRKIVPNYKRA